MLKIRRYQDHDREAVWHVHEMASISVGVYFDGNHEVFADLLNIGDSYQQITCDRITTLNFEEIS